MQRALCLVALAALVLAMPVQAVVSPSDDPDRLWLRAPTLADREHNFTTFAPNGTEADRQPAGRDPPEGRQWVFRMTHSPAPWTLEADASVKAQIVLEDVAAAVPLPNDPFDPLTYPGYDPQHVAMTVALYQGGDIEVLASGSTGFPLDPQDGAGTLVLDVPMDVPAQASINNEPGDAPDITLMITIHARFPSALTDMYGEPVVLVGGQEHASWVAIEGFPYEAFRAWDEHDRLQEACQPFYLQALECPHEATAELPADKGEQRESPALGALVPLLVIAGMGLARRVQQPLDNRKSAPSSDESLRRSGP